jgi:hypothetical protein
MMIKDSPDLALGRGLLFPLQEEETLARQKPWWKKKPPTKHQGHHSPKIGSLSVCIRRPAFTLSALKTSPLFLIVTMKWSSGA